jgi:ribosomal protein S19E (S16A)
MSCCGGRPSRSRGRSRRIKRKIKPTVEVASLSEKKKEVEMSVISCDVGSLVRDTLSKNIVEIGSQHPVPTSQKSTEILLRATARSHAKMWTVDIREDIKEFLEGLVEEKGANCEVVTMDGKKFLEEFDQDIAFLYLDNLAHRHPFHEGEICQGIKGYEVSVDGSEIVHMEQAKAAYKKVEIGGHILFDDTKGSNPWKGKGAKAIPWLLKNGYRLVYAGPPQTLLRRES